MALELVLKCYVMYVDQEAQSKKMFMFSKKIVLYSELFGSWNNKNSSVWFDYKYEVICGQM